jgi:hypothetical protein
MQMSAVIISLHFKNKLFLYICTCEYPQRFHSSNHKANTVLIAFLAGKFIVYNYIIYSRKTNF